MEYFILCLAVVCFAGQFAFTKSYEQAVKPSLVNTLVMLVLTSFFGALIYLVISGLKVNFSWFSFKLAIIFAFIMIPYYLLGIKALSLGSLAVYSVFMMLGGMLVPFFYGIIFLKENISFFKIIATILLTVFIILQSTAEVNKDTSTLKTEKNSKAKKSFFFILCLLIFFINGLTGVITKAHEIGYNPIDEISFTILYCSLTGFISLVILFGVMLLKRKTDKVNLKPTLKAKPVLITFLIGGTAYTGNYLHLVVASVVPASVQFPIVSGGVIVLSSIVSRLIFKEKISKIEWASVVGALVSTILFAF